MAPLKADNWKDVCHPAIATNYEAPSGKRYYGHGFRTLSECHQVWTVITINLYHHCASSESLQKWMCGYIKYHWSSSSSFWQRQWRLQENDHIAGVWAGHCWHVVIYILIHITVTLTFLQDCEEKHMRSGGSHALTGNPGLAAFLNFSLLVSLASTLPLTWSGFPDEE